MTLSGLCHAGRWLPTRRSSLLHRYPTEPTTLGEHLKKRRYVLGLFQKQVAARLRINEWTFLNWERDRTEPPVRLWPRIINFLGYYPSVPRSVGEQLLARRRSLGIRRKEMAKRLGVDEAILAKWEIGAGSSGHECLDRMEKFLTTGSYTEIRRFKSPLQPVATCLVGA